MNWSIGFVFSSISQDLGCFFFGWTAGEMVELRWCFVFWYGYVLFSDVFIISTSIPFVGNPYISPKNGVGNAIVLRFSWLGKWVGRSLVHLEIVWRSGNFGVWGGLETSNQELSLFCFVVGEGFVAENSWIFGRCTCFFCFAARKFERSIFFSKTNASFRFKSTNMGAANGFQFFQIFKVCFPKFRKFSTQLDNFQKNTVFFCGHIL